MKEVLICYQDSENYNCKIINEFEEEIDISNIYEFEEVVEFFDNVKNSDIKQFLNLEDIRNFYLSERSQIVTYLFQNHTWFSGIFYDNSNKFRGNKAEDNLNLNEPIANFFGWKISEKSNFAREKNTQIFKNSLKISDEIMEVLKISELIETANIWGTSISHNLIHLIVSDFNKKTSGLAIANYFEIWYWNEENKIFKSFDPEVPARLDNFNPKECLVFEEKFVFEFFKPSYTDRNWNVFQASIESEYEKVVNSGQPYDCAFYTITALNNLINYLKNKNLETKLYIHNC